MKISSPVFAVFALGTAFVATGTILLVVIHTLLDWLAR